MMLTGVYRTARRTLTSAGLAVIFITLMGGSVQAIPPDGLPPPKELTPPNPPQPPPTKPGTPTKTRTPRPTYTPNRWIWPGL